MKDMDLDTNQVEVRLNLRCHLPPGEATDGRQQQNAEALEDATLQMIRSAEHLVGRTFLNVVT